MPQNKTSSRSRQKSVTSVPSGETSPVASRKSSRHPAVPLPPPNAEKKLLSTDNEDVPDGGETPPPPPSATAQKSPPVKEKVQSNYRPFAPLATPPSSSITAAKVSPSSPAPPPASFDYDDKPSTPSTVSPVSNSNGNRQHPLSAGSVAGAPAFPVLTQSRSPQQSVARAKEKYNDALDDYPGKKENGRTETASPTAVQSRYQNGRSREEQDCYPLPNAPPSVRAASAAASVTSGLDRSQSAVATAVPMNAELFYKAVAERAYFMYKNSKGKNDEDRWLAAVKCELEYLCDRAHVPVKDFEERVQYRAYCRYRHTGETNMSRNYAESEIAEIKFVCEAINNTIEERRR